VFIIGKKSFLELEYILREKRISMKNKYDEFQVIIFIKFLILFVDEKISVLLAKLEIIT